MLSKFVGALLILTAGASPALAYPTACGCVELNRRIRGLEYVLSSGGVNGWEYNQIQQGLNQARGTLNSSSRFPVNVQEANCSRSNQMLDNEWVRWQPRVSQRGADIGNYCG
jgi:hypothetical protein